MALTLTNTGSATTSAAITALSSATGAWGKLSLSLATFTGAVANTSMTFCCADDNAANSKFEVFCGFGSVIGGANSMEIQLVSSNGGSTAQIFPTYSALPTSGDLIVGWFWTASGNPGISLWTQGGVLIASQVRGSGFGALTAGTTGFVRVNHLPIVHGKGGTCASRVNGCAIYSNAPPDTTFTSGSWFSAPASGDTGIVALWEMNDAFTGTSPTTAAAQVGAQALTPTTGQYTWAADTGGWFGQVPTTATISPLAQTVNGGATEQYTGTIKDGSSNTIVGEPVTWTSSATGVATINSTGLATAVGVGVTTIQVADVSNPSVNASTTLTVETAGTLSFTSAGSGVSTLVTGLANLQTTLSVKWCQKVDSLRTLGAALAVGSSAVGFLDADGANTGHKLAFGWIADASGNLNLKLHVFGVGDFSGPKAAYTTLPANGNYVICEIDAVTGAQDFNVYTAALTQVTGMSGSTALAFSMPTAGAPGVFTLNKDNSGSFFTQQANVYAGLAFYNTVLSGTGITSAPTATDAGIQAGWYMADATSGSVVTSAAAFAGGSALTLTGQTWLGDFSLWAPSSGQVPTTAVISPAGATLGATQTQQLTGTIKDGSGNPIVGAAVTWTSSATGVATVSGTGLVTAVATGQTTITLADTAAPSITATAVVTVTGLGTLSLSSTGSGLSGNIPAVAALQGAASLKWVQKTDQLISLGASLNVPVVSIDQDGAGTNNKLRLGWQTDAAGHINLAFSTPAFGVISGPALLQTSLPVAGNYIICEIDIAGTSQHFNAYTSALSQIAGLSGATATNIGTNWGTIPGANGRVNLNKDPSGAFSNQSALVYGGLAIYNTILSGTAVYLVPTAGDPGICAGWFMNDATTGSTPSQAAPFVGGQPLVLTNNTWLSNASAWTAAQVPTNAVVTPTTASITTLQTQQLTGVISDANGLPITNEPVTWSTQNSQIAVVNTTGGVTPVGPGTVIITLADTAVPTVSATSTITVTQGLATQATLTCTPYATSGSGSPISGLVASWTTDNANVATVSSTGLVTGVSAGTAHVTGTISGQSSVCTVTVT